MKFGLPTIVLSVLISLTTYAQEIPAGCTASANFSAAAYQTWVAEAVTFNASADAFISPRVPVGQRLELALLPQDTENSGFVNFEITAAGTYVIATDAYPRLDLLDLSSGEILNPTDFGKIRDCGTVSKTLRFEFTKSGRFSLKLTSRHTSMVNVLIWNLL